MTVVLNAMQLRGLAEWASGYRGEIIDFYEGENGRIGLWKRSKGPCPFPVILTCDTPRVVEDRPPVTAATMTAGGETVNLLKIPYGNGTVEADAVFWSESAVEKFLFPYYASKGSWQADLYAEALRTVFYGIRPLAEYQRVQENPGGFEDPNADAPPTAETDVIEEAFGLVHIPKSDYIPQAKEEDDEPAPLPKLMGGGELGVLVRHRETGAVRMRMLGEMVRSPEPVQPCAAAGQA